MAFDEAPAARLREELSDVAVTEKQMFGGLAFLVAGHMAVAASGQGGLLLRVDPADSAGLIEEPYVSRMERRGREMDGWLRIAAEALTGDDELARWVRIGVAYAGSLPPK